MNVEAAQARRAVRLGLSHQVQHPLRQDQPVGGHHHHLCLRIDQCLTRQFGVWRKTAVQPQAARLRHRDATFARQNLDRRLL